MVLKKMKKSPMKVMVTLRAVLKYKMKSMWGLCSCNMTLCPLSGMNRQFQKGWILLDRQSMVDVFSNEKLSQTCTMQNEV